MEREETKLVIDGMSPLLSVYDMPVAVHFYRDLLGFELVSHSPFYAEGLFHWCMLRRADVTIMLNTAYDEGERPDLRDETRIAAHNDVTLYIGSPDVDVAYEYVTARGITAKPPIVTHYGMKQLYIHDPDGYGICFQWNA